MYTYYYLTTNGNIQRITDSPQVLPDLFEVVMDRKFQFTDFNYSIIIAEQVKSNEFLIKFIRLLRNKKLLDTIWLNERHLSQLPNSKTLSEEEYLTWQEYWQQLRDLPNTIDFTDTNITKENIHTYLPSPPLSLL